MSASAIDRLRGFAEQSGSITASDERLVASELHVPVAAVHGAATFFDDLAPTRRGRRHVRVCEGTSCFAADRGQHINEVEHALGVTTGRCREDGAVSLQAVRCIGFCYAAPALLDGDTPHVGPDIADQLRTEQADEAPPIPVTASAEPVLLGGILSGHDPWRDWPDVTRSWPPQRLIAEVATSGLLGRGGAGYPASAKWAAAAGGAAPRYVVGNGDEGDPGSFCDRVLMEQDPHRVLAGLAYAAHAIGAERGYVYIRSEYPAAVRTMRDAVADATRRWSPGPRAARDRWLLGGGGGGGRGILCGRGADCAAACAGRSARRRAPPTPLPHCVRAAWRPHGGQQRRDPGSRPLDRRPGRHRVRTARSCPRKPARSSSA